MPPLTRPARPVPATAAGRPRRAAGGAAGGERAGARAAQSGGACSLICVSMLPGEAMPWHWACQGMPAMCWLTLDTQAERDLSGA